MKLKSERKRFENTEWTKTIIFQVLFEKYIHTQKNIDEYICKMNTTLWQGVYGEME